MADTDQNSRHLRSRIADLMPRSDVADSRVLTVKVPSLLCVPARAKMRIALLIASVACAALAAAAVQPAQAESDYAALLRQIRAGRTARRHARRAIVSPVASTQGPILVVSTLAR